MVYGLWRNSKEDQQIVRMVEETTNKSFKIDLPACALEEESESNRASKLQNVCTKSELRPHNFARQ